MMLDHEELKTGRGEILIVDDTPADRQLLTDILVGQGYAVRTASSGRLALRSVTAKAPYLIVLDVKMPEMDGFEVCRRLKADDHSREIPVIFLSAPDETVDKAKGFDAGGVDYISKPFQPEEVLARIGVQFRIRQLTDKLREANETLEVRVAERTTEPAKSNAELKAEIAERLKAQKALQQSEKLFRSFFNASAAGMAIIAPDGALREVNPALCDYLGCPREEMIGRTVESFTHPNDRDATHRRYLSLQAEEQPHIAIEKRYLRKDGTTFWGHASVTPVFDDTHQLDYYVALVQDITDRKQAEAAVRESERKLTTLMSNLPGMVYRCRNDRHWTMVFISEGCRALTGYAPEELLDNRRRPYNDLIHPEDREWLWPQIQSSVKDGQPFELKYRIRTASGKERWVWERGRGVFGPGGELLVLEGFITDITERKQAEEALQATQRRLENIIEFLPDATFVIDGDKKVVAWNRAMETMTGVGKKEVLGQGDYAYSLSLYGTRRPILIDLIGNPVPELEAQYDFIKRKGDTLVAETFRPSFNEDRGRYLWIIASPLLDRQGQIVGAIESIRDITDRKQAQALAKAALAEAEEGREKIDAILKSVADGLIVADLSGRVVLMNRAAEKLLGTTLGEAFSRPVDALLAGEGFGEQVLSVLAGRKELSLIEWEVTDPASAKPRAIQSRTAAVRNREGKTIGTITLLRDVSRERDLDRMKNEFISTAAHELRTPLTSVLGFSEVLLKQQEFGVTDSAQQMEIISIIHEKAVRLETIISELLDLSRIQSGQMISLNRAPFDIVQLLERAVSHYRQGKAGHRFEVSFPEEAIVLAADAGKLEQVLENLLSNAIKFSKPQSTIRVTGQVTGPSFLIAVTDEGIGMTPDQLERVFDKFYRVDASNTAVQGLGLGMSIAKNIVESHGGEIQVESEPGHGTTVSFAIPLE